MFFCSLIEVFRRSTATSDDEEEEEEKLIVIHGNVANEKKSKTL